MTVMSELDELLEKYKDGAISARQLIARVKNSDELISEIEKRTEFLDSYNPYDIIERLYYLVNGISEVVRCKYCSNKATWKKKSIGDGYRDICSSKECRSKQLVETHTGNTSISENRNSDFIAWQDSVMVVNDDVIKDNIKYLKLIPLITNSVILDYLKTRFSDSESLEETVKRIELGIEKKPICELPGCNNPVTFVGRKNKMFTRFCCPAHSNQSEETRRKCKETNKSHWGTENVYDSSIYQDMMMDKYGVPFHWLRDDVKTKRDMTCLERYGTIYPTQVKEIMDKVRQTTLENYGVECMFLEPSVFDLAHSEETREKIRSTFREKYDADSPLGNPEVRERIEQTNLEKFGYKTPLLMPEVIEKAHSPETLDKIKKTNIERYNSISPLSDPEVRKKSYETLIENAKQQKSKKEDEVADYIESLGYVVERHHLTDVFPFNADIYLPEYDLYIEYQGSHFHNTYSFLGTKEDFELLKNYNDKSNELKKNNGGKLTQYDNMIYVWSDLDVRKRVYAQEHNVNYLEIYKVIDVSEVGPQLDILIRCMKKLPLITVSDDNLKREFSYYKNIGNVKELVSGVSKKNLIVKHFQCTEFFKTEMEIYASKPLERRKLIQNRCKYLDKKEFELTPDELMTGFKKSGIYYGYSHFNPMWTAWFVQRYGIKRIYDSCGGWGHHMLGMLSCEQIYYNEINIAVSDNVKKMKDYFNIENLDVHTGDARIYEPGEVDAFFMCPPYFNVEKYSNEFDNIEEYEDFLKSVFLRWKNSTAKIFGLIIREDFLKYVGIEPVEQFDVDYGRSHFDKINEKKFKEMFYIFKK